MREDNKFELEDITFQSYVFRVIWFLFLIYGHYLVYSFFTMPFSELEKLFNIKEVHGGAGQAMSQTLQFIAYRYFGREGIIILFIIAIIGLDWQMFSDISKLIRYHRKCKLYKRGLVNNLDDDYEFPRLSVFIKNIFTKDKSKRRHAFRSKKEYREMQKKFEKDELYKKMYTDKEGYE